MCGDNIHHTVLSSATGLESPKSLASDRASFLDSLSSIAQVALTSPSLCASILVFFSSFKLIVLSLSNENFFGEEVKKIGNCCCLVLFFIKLSLRLDACTHMYLRAEGVQARMQVGCHLILSFVLLLASSSSSSSIRGNKVFYMFPFYF